MYYLIDEKLIPTSLKMCMKSDKPYVAVMTSAEWKVEKDAFRMGIDLDIEYDRIHTTKAEVNVDSLTGGFTIPDKINVTEQDHEFTFALDEKGIVFIDDDGLASQIVTELKLTRKWRLPSFERFLYDFLNKIVFGDLAYLGNVEDELAALEEKILARKTDNSVIARISELRRALLRLRTHYEQLMDLSQEFYENENNFFAEPNLRYFDMFSGRVNRLQAIVGYLQDYSVQVRELYSSAIAVEQNNNMAVLTIVTVIFTPLTVLVGWYGMNFKYMPELESPMAYPIIIIVAFLSIVGGLLYFKRKHWL
jgi:magnesium transporter